MDAAGEVLAQLPQAVAQARITVSSSTGRELASRVSEREEAPWQEEFSGLPVGLVRVRILFYDASRTLLGSSERDVSVGTGATASVLISSLVPDQGPPPQPPAEAVRLGFVVQPGSLLAGEAFRVEVAALDAEGQRVPDATGTVRLRLEGGATLAGASDLALSDGLVSWAGLSVTPAASGLVLVAESEGLQAARSAAFSVGEVPPVEPERVATSLAFSLSPSVLVTAGEAFTLEVEVRDQFGSRLSGGTSSLRLSLADDPVPPVGAVFEPLTTAAVDGTASFSVALTRAGSYRFSVTSEGLVGATSAVIEVGAASPYALVFLEVPQGGTARVALAATSVGVQDAYGNAVSAAELPITVALEGGGSAVLSGTLRLNSVAGIATFGDLELDRANAATRLVATSGVLLSATSAPFDVVAATANRLSFVSAPSGTFTAGASPDGDDAVVEVLDEQGERVLDFDGDIWLQLKAGGFVKAEGAGGELPTLVGASVAAVDGVATFPDLSANFTGAYTVQANAAGIASALPEASFNVTYGAPARIVITSQPTSGEIAVSLQGSSSAELRDALENRITSVLDNRMPNFYTFDSTVGLTSGLYAIAHASGSYLWATGPWGQVGQPSGHGNFEVSFPGLTTVRGTRFPLIAWQEFMVSQGVVGNDLPDALERRIDVDGQGNFAVVSNNSSIPTTSRPVRFRLYDAAGVPKGFPIAVDSGTRPNIAMNFSGDFVIAYLKGNTPRVYARCFHASGMAKGPEFVVATSGRSNQPALAISDTGEFALAWTSDTSSNGDVMVRRYDSDGIPRGPEFRVNTVTDSLQQEPSIALGRNGEMMVTWRSTHLHGQVYNADGPVGTELNIGATGSGNTQSKSSVAVDSLGRFVVVWDSSNQDGSGLGVFARRYNSAAQAIGDEFRVNTYTSGNQSSPMVDTDPAGNFVVVWNSVSGQDGSDSGVYMQRYDSNAVAQGAETRVNTTTQGYQGRPSVAVHSLTSFVVAWRGTGKTGGMSNLQPADAEGILARRFERPVTP